MSLEPRLRNTAWTELPVGRFCSNYFICISSFIPTLGEWYHYRSHRTDEETGAGKWTNLPRTTRLVRAKLKLETGRQAAETMPSPDSTRLLLLVLLARIQAIHTSLRPSLLTPFSSVPTTVSHSGLHPWPGPRTAKDSLLSTHTPPFASPNSHCSQSNLETQI